MITLVEICVNVRLREQGFTEIILGGAVVFWHQLIYAAGEFPERERRGKKEGLLGLRRRGVSLISNTT